MLARDLTARKSSTTVELSRPWFCMNGIFGALSAAANPVRKDASEHPDRRGGGALL